MRNVLPLLCVVGLTACEADTPGHFQATCAVATVLNPENLLRLVTLTTPCRVDDQPETGYNNKFRILFTGENLPNDWRLPRTAEYVRVEARDGNMIVTTALWGVITVRPHSPSIREVFRKAAAFEVRPQNLTLRVVADGVELLIDEPWGEFNGGSTDPSPDWISRHAQAFRLLGRAQ